MKSLLYMVTRFYVYTFVLVFVSGDGASTTNNTLEQGNRIKRLVGGRDTRISLHSYFVSLEDNKVPVCGGAIVSTLYVLTAAHCNKTGTTNMLIRAGSDQLGKRGSLHSVQQFTSHPRYYSTDTHGFFNDIAVILVGEPFQFDRTHQPIPLFNVGERVKPNIVASIVGFGLIKPGGRPTQLQRIIIPVVNKKKCNNKYRELALADGIEYEKNPPGTFCTGYEQGGVDTCTGDSGGPVVIAGRLAGIVSFGIGCGLPKVPGINTNIPYFRQWIRDQIGF